MAKDDYFVIAYRFLKYLYDCLKKSKKPNPDVVDGTFFGVADDYWEYVIRHLTNDGYIEGAAFVPVLGLTNPRLSKIDRVAITPKGILYLEDNSAFSKIRGAVKDIAEILPF
jgi:hypothetical protein